MLRLTFASTLFILVAAQPRAPIVSTLDVQVLSSPSIVTIAGQRQLVYELHLTNLRSSSEVMLTSIAVLDPDRGDAPIATLRDEALRDRLGRPGAPADLADKRRIGAGLRAVVYLWLPLDSGGTVPASPGPARLRHRIELDKAVIDTDPIAVRQQAPIELDPPLRGGPWVALYDPLLIGGHRTAIYALGGRARIAARFAIDWVRLSPEGARARGDVSQIANWYGYGADVFAVADAVVVDAKDDIAESPTLIPERVALENVSGNYICLDLGGGRFAFYEHLKHGSVRVKPGDRVTRGQVLAALGNSGGSSAGPHLHFHVADGRDELAAEGLPYVFTQFNVIGAFPTIDAFTRDADWNPAPASAAGRRHSELPAANVVVQFPQ